MKRSLHILVLLFTLLWTCAPVEALNHQTIHDRPTKHHLQTESGSQFVVINLPVKSDTRVDWSVSTILPDNAQRDVVRWFAHRNWTRQPASFIGSHHIYTQITSSYL